MQPHKKLVSGMVAIAIERNFQTLKKRCAIHFHIYLLHSSHATFVTFAMTSSRIASFAGESETKTEIAICCPFGSVTIPTSLVAAVTPFTVDERSEERFSRNAE